MSIIRWVLLKHVKIFTILRFNIKVFDKTDKLVDFIKHEDNTRRDSLHPPTEQLLMSLNKL